MKYTDFIEGIECFGSTIDDMFELVIGVPTDEIISLGCNAIEMETASAFRAASLSGFSLGALLSVSENTLLK